MEDFHPGPKQVGSPLEEQPEQPMTCQRAASRAALSKVGINRERAKGARGPATDGALILRSKPIDPRSEGLGTLRDKLLGKTL